MSNQETKSITSSVSMRNYNYCIIDKLGSGSFAEVYKGIIDDTNEEIAIKVISKLAIAKYGPDIRNAIGSEVNILQKISHSVKTPYIVKIYECFETQNNIYIILEFCNEGTLGDVLKKSKTLPEKESLIIIYQIIQALNVMASKEIAHRDIKPENIFIHNGIYKIGDFGFASQKKIFGTTLGTYPYMAPEIFQNKDYTSKIDVWAVGVMLHEMLFGELYFIGNSHMEVANNVQKKKYEIKQPSHLSVETQNLLIKCLEKNPDFRITANEMKNHKAFETIKNMPIFRIQNESSDPVAKDSLEVNVLILNYIKAMKFLEDLGEKICENLKNGKFCKFYLLNEAQKLTISLLNYVNDGNNPLMTINESKRVNFMNSKIFEECKFKVESYLKKLSEKYEYFIIEFNNQINFLYPKENFLILMLVNNAMKIDIYSLYKDEMVNIKSQIIKKGNQNLTSNETIKAKEYFLIAYEICLAKDIEKILKEQFDFIKYENNKKNMDFEEVMKQIK